MVKPPRIREGLDPDHDGLAYVGIDPGKTGGIAVITWSPSYPRGWQTVAHKMPKTEREIWKIISGVRGQNRTTVIESVHAMPGNGVSGMFKFGWGYGGLRMALVASDTPFEAVQPRAWQKALGVIPRRKAKRKKGQKGASKFLETPDQFKNRLLARAQELFPKVELTLATCDAALIALYCKRKHEGTL